LRTETTRPQDLEIPNSYESIPIIKSFTSIDIPTTATTTLIQQEEQQTPPVPNTEYTDLLDELIKYPEAGITDNQPPNSPETITTTEPSSTQILSTKSAEVTTSTGPVYTTFEFLSTITGMGLGLVPVSSTQAILAPDKNKESKSVNPYNWYHIFSDEYKKGIEQQLHKNIIFNFKLI